MPLSSRRAYAVGVGITVGLASLLLCWLATQDSLRQPPLWQPRAEPDALVPRKEPASEGDLLQRPRPMQESSLDDTEPYGAGLRAAEIPSREPAAAGAEVSRIPPAPEPQPLSCSAICKLQGYTGTCSQAIQWLADNEYRQGEQACWLAHAKVLTECPSCSGCDLLLAGCSVPCDGFCLLGGRSAPCRAHVQRLAGRGPPGPANRDTCRAATAYVAAACEVCSACRTAATGCVLPCERQCTFRSVTAYCRTHIQWLVDHDFSERQDACDAAHHRVLSECPRCRSCALSDSGCKMLGNSSVQKKLLQGIYGISVPNPLKQLPSCAKKLRVFVYDISSEFNADLIASIHKRRNHSNCDYEVTQCFEERWDMWYSVRRSCAGEVPLLLKFLSMPRITDNADEADLFVVPWFGALNRFVMMQPWLGGDGTSHARTRRVITQLPYMRDKDKARRHVFVSSTDHDNVDTTLLDQGRAGALLLHYGPSAGPDEIVAVPSGAGFGAPLKPLRPARNFLFYMAGAVNEFRRLMDSEVERLQTIRPDLKVVRRPIEGHRKLGLTPAETQRAMARSLLCPIAQGDLPFQHRFFDALVSGCLPVVVRYAEAGKCDTWSWKGHRGNLSYLGAWPRPCVNNTYPLPSSLRYEDVVVQVPSEKFKEGLFAETLAGLDRRELDRKRRRLEGHRHLFVYDRTGETYDAFSGVLQEICKAIGAG